MNRRTNSRIWFLIFLLNWSVTHADNSQSVTDWTQEVLLSTFAASYLDTSDDVASVEQYFYPYAWGTMVAFLRDKHDIIDAQKLILHPLALTPPKIMKSGYCENVRCWRINQSIRIPELHLNIDISVLVVSSTAKTPFLIQSLDMNLNSNP